MDERAYFDREYFERHPGKEVYFQALLELLQRHGVRTGRVLDIGSGFGHFLGALETAGYEATGLDRSPFANMRATAAGHATVTQEAESRLPFPDRYFAAVTLLDVVEHLDDYHTTLLECARTLAPGGLAIVVTLNRFSLLHMLLRRQWSYYQDPTHRHMFSIRVLKKALERAGFRDVRAKTVLNLGLAGETNRFLRPLRRLARIVAVPFWGDSIWCTARRP